MALVAVAVIMNGNANCRHRWRQIYFSF